jgi:succinoglycan biosynthesis protein ExoM
MLSSCEISILICTYKRPSLEECLLSIMKDMPESCRILTIIVVDNDPRASARVIVESLPDNPDISIFYHQNSTKNISTLRNLCLDQARGDFVAFIDDDETADPGWLDSLLHGIEEEEADAAIGRVMAGYDPAGNAWIAAGDPLSRPSPPRGTRLVTGATNNALVRLATLRRLNVRFDEQWGRTGGEDSAFFRELHARGGKIVSVPDAIVRETVPASRLTWAWLCQRALRNGALYACQAHGREHLLGRLILASRWLAAVILSALWLVITRPFSPSRSVHAFMRIFLNLGKLKILAGYKPSSWI